MSRGRKPLPAAVKKLRGNPGKRKIVPDQAPPMKGATTPPGADEVAALPVPPAPAHMGKIAREEWRRLAAQMVRLGTLRELDRTVFEARCEAYERLLTARRQLKGKLTYTAPNGTVRVHPLVKVIEAAERVIRAFDSEFGLTPAARARVAHVTGEERRAPAQPALPHLEPAPPSDRAAPGETPPAAQSVSDDEFFRGPPTRH